MPHYKQRAVFAVRSVLRIGARSLRGGSVPPKLFLARVSRVPTKARARWTSPSPITSTASRHRLRESSSTYMFLRFKDNPDLMSFAVKTASSGTETQTKKQMQAANAGSGKEKPKLRGGTSPRADAIAAQAMNGITTAIQSLVPDKDVARRRRRYFISMPLCWAIFHSPERMVNVHTGGASLSTLGYAPHLTPTLAASTHLPEARSADGDIAKHFHRISSDGPTPLTHAHQPAKAVYEDQQTACDTLLLFL
eukprot:COSAG01_NODE_1531_length_10004_cov_5.769006_7_plen_251_part_00